MNTVCGIDIAKDEIVATILSDNTTKETRKFGVKLDNLIELKKWLKEKNCTQTIMESTGIYWIPIYTSLEESNFEVILANPRQVKAIPGRKTDVKDSNGWPLCCGANWLSPHMCLKQNCAHYDRLLV